MKQTEISPLQLLAGNQNQNSNSGGNVYMPDLLNQVLGKRGQGAADITQNKFDKEKLDRIYRFPANYKEALVHARATRFGYTNNTLKNGENVPVCPCCENLTATLDIPSDYATNPGVPQVGRDVFLLQTGASLYFTFIKMTLIYLLLRFLIFDLFSLIASMQGHYCSSLIKQSISTQCVYTTYSAYNLMDLSDQQKLNVSDILSLVLTLASIGYFMIVRKWMYRLISWLDYNEVSQKDFSVLLQNLPMILFEDGTTVDQVDFNYEYNLKTQVQYKIEDWLDSLKLITKEDQAAGELDKDFWKFIYSKRKKNFDDRDQDEQPIVTSITLCYDLTEMENVNTERDKLIEEYLQLDEADEAAAHRAKNRGNRQTISPVSGSHRPENQQSEQKERLIAHIPNRIDLLNREYMNLCYKFALDESASFHLSHFTGRAFVSFQYQHYRDYFVSEHQSNKQFFKINNRNVEIQSASKPEDIYWYNLKIPNETRRRYIFYSNAILFMLLVLSFSSLMGLQIFQNNQVVDESKVKAPLSFGEKLKANAITLGMAILTNIINYILSYSTQLLSDIERHKTKTQRLNSLIVKTIASQTLNTLFIYYILYHINPINPLSQNGLVSKIVDLVMVSGFISVILQIFPPMLILNDCLNRYRYGQDKPINLFQVQLNQKMQSPQFNFATMYSFYIVYTFVVSFYGYIAPLATPIMIAIFFVQYWVDKYNLFRRYSSPIDFGSQLIRKMFKVFQLSILLCAIGHFVWNLKIHYDSQSGYRAVCIINLSICTIYVGISWFAPHRITQKLFGQEEYDHHNYYYYLKKNKFPKTYFRESPATSCLKEKRLNKKKNRDYQHEAPDLVFVKPRDFDKYINLKNDDITVDVYDKLEVQYFQNFDNQDYDQVAAELVVQELVVGPGGNNAANSLWGAQVQPPNSNGGQNSWGQAPPNNGGQNIWEQVLPNNSNNGGQNNFGGQNQP